MSGIANRLSAAFATVHIRPTLISVLIVYGSLTLIQATLTRARFTADARAVQTYTLALRARLYSAIARAEWLTLSRIRSSDFTFALTTAVDQVDKGANNLLYLIATSAIALVYAVIAFRVSPVMSAIVLGTSFLLLLVERARTLLGRTRGEQVSSAPTSCTRQRRNSWAGSRRQRAMVTRSDISSCFCDVGRHVNAVQLALTKAFASLRWQMTVGSVLALSVILYLAVGVFHLPTAAILLLLFLFSRLVPRLVALQQSFQEILSTVPALETIENLIERCERSPERAAVAQLPIGLSDEVKLSDVSFSYPGQGEQPQIDSISLRIPAARTTAIVGSSGAGKSTLADILLGLIKPQKGSILVDRVPLDDTHLESWRGQIGYVAQDTFLFNDTVRFNLDWAQPDAGEAEMLRALENAAALDFVQRLPSGLDTVIGERGVRLSGGERQRLSLARALLRNPRLLILDEATSALDSENEERIYHAIQQLHGEMTIVVITHRLSTIRNADAIHVLDSGRVVASGSWEELLAGANPRFRELGRAQGVL